MLSHSCLWASHSSAGLYKDLIACSDTLWRSQSYDLSTQDQGLCSLFKLNRTKMLPIPQRPPMNNWIQLKRRQISYLTYNVCWSGWVSDLPVLEMHCFQVNPFALSWYFASVNTKSSAQEDTGCVGHRCSQSFLIAICVFVALKRLHWTVHVIKCCCISAMIVITDVFRMDHIPLALTVWSPVVWPSLF